MVITKILMIVLSVIICFDDFLYLQHTKYLTEIPYGVHYGYSQKKMTLEKYLTKLKEYTKRTEEWLPDGLLRIPEVNMTEAPQGLPLYIFGSEVELVPLPDIEFALRSSLIETLIDQMHSSINGSRNG